MDCQDKKCVLLLDSQLPPGLLANTAAILGITLGKRLPEVVGPDVSDRDGHSHLGIIAFPVPVLQASPEALRDIRARLYQPEFQSLTAVDFSDLAQGCRTYDAFMEKMADAPEDSLGYLGLAICGPKKQVNRLTGSLPLLR